MDIKATMLPINDMMLFVEVVKYNSFTMAAQKNNIYKTHKNSIYIIHPAFLLQ